MSLCQRLRTILDNIKYLAMCLREIFTSDVDISGIDLQAWEEFVNRKASEKLKGTKWICKVYVYADRGLIAKGVRIEATIKDDPKKNPSTLKGLYKSLRDPDCRTQYDVQKWLENSLQQILDSLPVLA